MADNEASSAPGDQGRCIAVTSDGTRCSRPAKDGDFCFQHDESYPTIDDVEEREDSQAAREGGGETVSEGAVEHDQQEGETEAESSVDDGAEAELVDELDELAVKTDGEGSTDIMEVREKIEENASDLIGRRFDGITEIRPNDDGWLATVEMVERQAVPNTQDIIGRYEIELDDGGNVTAYSQINRYRRGDRTGLE